MRPKPRAPSTRLKMPEPGEIIETHRGPAEVIAIKNWEDVKNEFNSEEERNSFIFRVEFFLGSVDRYFEYEVRYLESGEYGRYDWSEYGGNFSSLPAPVCKRAYTGRAAVRGQTTKERRCGNIWRRTF